MEKNRTDQNMDVTRLTSFSDNVLSVAITLLVFDVRVPADWKRLELKQTLMTLGPFLLSFTLSFCAIGVYWVAHNSMLAAVTRVSRPLMWFNNLFLMTVCLVPASAVLLGNFPGQPAAVILYGSNLFAVGTSMQVLWYYIVQRQAKLGAPVNPELTKSGRRRIGSGIVLALAGICLADLHPWLAYTIYWTAPISFILLQLK